MAMKYARLVVCIIAVSLALPSAAEARSYRKRSSGFNYLFGGSLLVGLR